MRRLVALFLVILAVAAFATTASAKARGEVVWGRLRSEEARAQHGP
jgi:hypothetical protein